MNEIPHQPHTQSGIHPDHVTLIRLLDEAPLRLPHYLAGILSSGGTLIDGVSVFMLGIAMPMLKHDFTLNNVQTGLLGAALVAGAAAGASLGGRSADRIGRKSIFLLDLSLIALAAILSALAWNPWQLICAQFLTGVGVGMDFPVSSSYMAECMPQRSRSRMMVATIASQSLGLLLAGSIVLGLLHLFGTIQTWRLFFASEAALAILFLLARMHLPESPRWLMSQGRNREAAHALERMVPEDSHILEVMATRLGNTEHYVTKVAKPTNTLGWRILFISAYRRRTLLSTLPWFMMDIATYGVGLFTAVLLGAFHLNAHAHGSTAQLETLATASSIIDLFLLLGFLLGLWSVARFGRIRMQLFGFAGMALGMSLLFIAASLPAGPAAHPGLVFLGFIIFNLLMNMGPNSTTYILPSELFPTQLRASGAGFAAASAKIGATLGVFFLPIVQSRLGLPGVLALMTGVSLLGLLFTYQFRVEGHNLTLEQHHTEALP